MGLGWSEWKKPKIGFIPSSENTDESNRKLN